MKYAELNEEKIEAQKGIKNAICPVCREVVIPKCGNVKIHHWAHKNNQNCDLWWKSETEWHRNWKNSFPKECQEVVMYDDKTEEKHVADIKTKTGYVIEFQHSSLKFEEQEAREKFYKNMIWIVDVREDKYYKKFKKYMKNFKKVKFIKNIFMYQLMSLISKVVFLNDG